MKKEYESPKLEANEFAVAARLLVSGTGNAHDQGKNTVCALKASNGGNVCTDPSASTSTAGSGTGFC